MTPIQSKQIALNGMAFQRLVDLENRMNNLVSIQCSNGNWNYSAYMMGLANGLILARSLLTGEDPDYMSPPDEWLQDRDARQ